MKKLISILLCVACFGAFTSCGESVEPAKTIFVGQIYVDLPDGWIETMESDQTTFTFHNNRNELLGRMVITAAADETPAKITEFQDTPETVQGQGFAHSVTILSGAGPDGQAVTEYHYFHKKRDYTFLFTHLVTDDTIHTVLDSIKPV